MLKNKWLRTFITDPATEEDMRDLLEQFPAPIFLQGDSNTHNPLEGSEKMSKRGRMMEKILDRYNPFVH